MKSYKDVDTYIKDFPDEIQEKLVSVRDLIKEIAPEAVESISYGMPGYKLNGKVLVYFAAFKDHISVYPTSDQIEKGIPEAAKYRTGKGTLQFSLKEPLPLGLIKQIVEYRVKQLEK
jgi:uncharacterized protein YdhG (YjbR/CyaY superfamily)